MQNNKEHWENLYQSKETAQMSWYQNVPLISLDFIYSLNVPKDAAIIDIGGGDSRLVDFLLEAGYENISVLDISEKALQKAKERLGKQAKNVKWIVSDIIAFQPESLYDIWHDRATFHFLTTNTEIEKYLSTARKAISKYLTIGTFSENGPLTCSGLTIKRYSEEELQKQLAVNHFKKVRCIHEDHITPFNTRQNFLFCSFKKELTTN